MCSSDLLEAYETRMEKLVRLWGDAWHLIYTTDDHMRAEQIERLRRQISTGVKAGHPQPAEWTEAEPWSAVFHMAAADTNYWDEHVTGPAQAWRTSGAKGTPRTLEEISTSASGQLTSSIHVECRPPPQLQSPRKRNRLPKWEREQHQRSTPQSDSRPSKGGKSGKGNGGKSGKQGEDSKDKSAQPCWSFSKGFGVCKEAAPNSECPEGRSHVCHLCKGPHQASQCR